MHNLVYAQTSEPDTVSGLVLWLDAKDVNGNQTLLANNSQISQWSDKSSLGHHVTSNGVDEPSYEMDGMGTNLPGLRFTTNDFLSGPDILTEGGSTSEESTIFLVLSNSTLTQNHAFSLNGTSEDGSGSNPRYSFDAPWIDGSVYYDAGGCCGTTRNVATYTLALGETAIISGVNDRPSNRQALRIEGTIVDSDNTGHITPTNGGINIGAYATSPRVFDGYFAEIIVYNRALTNSEIDQVENYLFCEWKPASATNCDPVLTVDKSASSSSVDENTNVTFTITATETAGVNANNLVITDVLPSGLTFVSSPTGSYDSGSNTITWNVAGPLNGSSANVSFVASADEVSSNTNITNTASVVSDEVTTSVTANETITVTDIPTDPGQTNVNFCPYVHNLDGNTPAFNHDPFWTPGNVDNNLHVSSQSAISSDASGTGMFLANNTHGVPQEGLVFGVIPTLSVAPNTPYRVRFHVANINTINNAHIEPFVNGSSLGPASSVPGVGVWHPVDYTWNSGAATTASLDLEYVIIGGNDGHDFGLDEISLCSVFDFSDAPISGTNYQTASHAIIGGMHLGTGVTFEDTASANATATGDSDDGVALPTLQQGEAATIPVTIAQNTSNSGRLQAWVDWNGDGDFADSGEQVATDMSTASLTGTIHISVTVPIDATTTQTFARFRWSTTPGLSSTATANDGEVEDYALTIATAAIAELTASKSVAMYDPATQSTNTPGIFAIPGNDAIYTTTVTNIGDGPVDTDTLFLADRVADDTTFYNADMDDGGPATDPVTFTQNNGASLTFTYGTDIAFSSGATSPASFAACTYTPIAGYDVNVTYICINPKGSMQSGDPDPSFTISYRAQLQ